MEKLLAPLQNGQTASLDEASRVKLQDSLHEAAESLETPYDTMLRFLNAGRLVGMAKIGFNLNIFKTLAASATPVSVEQLSSPFKGDPLLVGRVLRYLAANRIIVETEKNLFAANKTTKSLADPRIEGGLLHAFHISTPAYQALPDYLQEYHYQNTTGGHCAWHKSANSDLDFFPWAKQHPDILKYFQQLMSVPREGSWLDVIPFADQVADMKTNENAVFVDIGGNIGHQCARLKAKYPQLEGRIVLQDREETIKSAPPIEGVEFMVHDFFTPQPIKGAKFYYLRAILHDWEDDKAAEILKNIIPAMGLDSQILIDDLALPNVGAHYWSCCIDMQMYVMHGAMERTLDQWRALLERAGLELVDVRTWSPVMRNSIIVAVPKKKEANGTGHSNEVHGE